MGFTQLPTELKIHILKLCKEGDRAYKDRKKIVHSVGVLRFDTDLNGENEKEMSGRSFDGLSRVNTEIRGLALPILFEVNSRFENLVKHPLILLTIQTLRVINAHGETFNDIFSSSTARSCITHLSFDNFAAVYNDPDAFTHFLTLICPALPNLHKVTGLQQSHVSLLTKTQRMDEYGYERSGTPSLALRKAFLRLASRIRDWDVNLKLDDIEAIVSANVVGIRSLKAVYNVPRPESYAKFLSLVSRCTQLTSLSMAQEDREEEEEIPDGALHFDQEAASMPLAFVDTLRSIAYREYHPEAQRISYGFLQLAERFSNLSHLCIPLDLWSDCDSDPVISPFVFPHLRHLEILHTSIFTNTTLVYPLLKLPRLTSLTLAGFEGSDLLDHDKASYWFTWHFKRFSTSVRHLHLIPPPSGFPRILVDRMTRSFPFELHCSDISGLAHSDRQDFYFPRLSDSSLIPSPYIYPSVLTGPPPRVISAGNFSSTSGIGREEPVHRGVNLETAKDGVVYRAGRETSEWMMEKFEGMRRQGDVAGTKELIRILKPVGEWRKWLED